MHNRTNKTNITYRKLNFEQILFLFLFLVIPFIQTESDLDAALRLSINVLPSFISVYAAFIRWAIIALFIILYLLKFRLYNKNFTSFNFLIIAFYSVLFLYSMIDQTDILRYSGLVVLALVLPLITTYSFNSNRELILKYCKLLIYFFIVVSILLSWRMILYGHRFQGFSSGSNSYGITAVFWLTLLLIPNQTIKKGEIINNIFIGLLILTIVLSGSRTSVIMAIVTLLFYFRFNVRKFLLPLLLVIGVIAIILFYFDISAVVDRVLNFRNSVSDSGRSEVWSEVISKIKSNLFWGNGMNAYESLHTLRNVHNGYLRLFLSMGVVFSVLSLLFYFSFLLKSLNSYKNIKIPPTLIAYFLAFSLGNMGEDLFFGVGSPIIISLFITIGLYVHFYNEMRIKF